MLSMNSANSMKKSLSLKGLESATSCVRDPGCYHSTSKTHVRDRIFKLNPIHASVEVFLK